LLTLYLISLTLVELFYVGAGFGLYLNTRTKLEGWDIELTFRKLAARLRAAALTALIVAGSVMIAEAKSESDRPPAGIEATSHTSANPAKESIQSILAKPEFEIHTRIQKVPVSKDSDSTSSGTDGWPLLWVEAILKLIAWAIVAGLLGLLIWWLVQNRHLFRFSRQGRLKPIVAGPRVIMGMEISRESLPEDLLQAAREAWQRGDLRAALSLLYRGALSRLVEQNRLPIRDSDTEDDCLTHVRKTCERPITDYFARLTRLWEGAAYAGVEAGAADFDFLCSAWPFDGAGTPAPGRHRDLSLFLLGLSLWSLGACEYREEKITTGYQGKARSDPFLAAQQLLGEYDHDAKKVTSLSKLPEDPEDTVIVISGESGMSEGRARQLMQWAARGGHVIYALAGCRPYNDWSIFSTFSNIAYFGNEEREDALLKSLGVTLEDTRVHLHDLEKDAKKETAPKDEKTDVPPPNKKHESPKAKAPGDDDDKASPKSAEEILTTVSDVAWRSKVFHVEMPAYVTFNLNRKLALDEFSAGPLDKATALGLRHGSGRITLLNHARPFRNRYIGDADHAAWLLALAGEYPQNVMFVLALEGSFWTLLWAKGWMVVAGIGALTGFWLWRNLPRFGPARHVELHETKHFVEHVSALGQFFHAFRRNDILLTAAADAVRTRAFRRFPQLSGSGDAAIIPLLAERSHLPEERIRIALSPPASHPPHSLVRILHDLQTLRQALA
jgi:hypothetical protein